MASAFESTAGKTRVLVVDDEVAISDYLAHLLVREGYSVAVASNGEHALEELGRFRPDIVLLDIQMPIMDGLEVCRQLRSCAETQLLPVIFITAMGDQDTKLKCISVGCNDFLNKPFDSIELIARVKSLRQVKQLTDQLESAETVLRTLARTVEAKDPYTHGHSERVADYTSQLARFIGLSEEDQDRLRRAGLLHDIGKIAVREEILHKPGDLTDGEFDLVKSHPVVGERILLDLKLAQPYLASVRHHHERIDGKGYPDKLSGDDIPLDARLMAIADAYDAMTSNRPYRDAMPKEKALAILSKNNGPQWDLALVEGFINLAGTW